MTEMRKKFTATAPKSTMNTAVMMNLALNLIEFVGLVLAIFSPHYSSRTYPAYYRRQTIPKLKGLNSQL
jgi:hypothetical protein